MKWDGRERAGGCESGESREKKESMKGQDKRGGVRRRREEREEKRKGGKRTQKRTKSWGQRRDEKRHQTGVRGGLAGWRARCFLIEAKSMMLR